MSNLLADAEYAPLGKFLKDSKLPEPVLDVLIVDVLNRPNGLKLPLLLEVAREPQHPKAAEAKDLLELYLEEDYGTDIVLHERGDNVQVHPSGSTILHGGDFIVIFAPHSSITDLVARNRHR